MPKRDLVRKIDIRPQGVRVYGGSAGGAMTAHDIVGALHFVDGRAGLVVGVNPDDTLALLWLDDLLELWGGLYLGRWEGPHVGLIITQSDEGEVHTFELMDSGGGVLASYGYVLDVPNSYWIKLGPADGLQITYTNDGSRDGIEKPGVWSVPAAIIDGYLPFEHGATLPDAFDRAEAYPFALISPGDPYSFVLYMRDNLDGWQRLIGAGYAAVHTHTSDETGGLLSVTGGGIDDILTAGGYVLVGADGHVLWSGL